MGFLQQQFLFLLISFCLLLMGQKPDPQVQIPNVDLLCHPISFLTLSLPSVRISFRQAEE